MAGPTRPSHLFVGMNVCGQRGSLTRWAHLAFMICALSRAEHCLAALLQVGSINFARSFHNGMIVDRASTFIEFNVAIIYS